ncbi:Beta-glucan synthesis-associated protein [Venturia nashicola]|uniref:Beta-glucan synthesis-associated protein n=1 Tax=Venturia nashicola TaxID=86259 RepID=A0A4Z1P065_9PEZI|nr:Beta-glucan synthesis-associated protein [Venturia nashicola]
MLHDCDTCDETFDDEEACQLHMQDLGHYISSDTFEDRNRNTNRVVASSSVSSLSDSESLDGNLVPDLVHDTKDDKDENIQLSKPSSNDAEEQGISIPTSALPIRSKMESTKQWAATQNLAHMPRNTVSEGDRSFPVSKNKRRRRRRKGRKGSGDQSPTVKCETCHLKFSSLDAVEQHMVAKDHYRSDERIGRKGE